jgi:RimJ/RimL family protein N-acetyltransferase
MKDIYRGELVRLATESPEAFSKAFARWDRDSEYIRLADSDPNKLWSERKHKEWIEKQMEQNPVQSYRFSIRTLAEDRLIGEVAIRPNWIHADAMFGIVIGERDYWGKGYGTDATRLIVQYGFIELNLHHIMLGVLAYNPRAIRAYEKAGFRMEGAVRGEALREGRRIDCLYMGILREEWLAQQAGAA